jgi:hypothetical protein
MCTKAKVNCDYFPTTIRRKSGFSRVFNAGATAIVDNQLQVPDPRTVTTISY